jgi:hypothetical protein
MPCGAGKLLDSASRFAMSGIASSARASMLLRLAVFCRSIVVDWTVWIDPDRERAMADSSDSWGANGLDPCQH